MPIEREKRGKYLRLERSMVFPEGSPGIRVLSKKYFLNTEVVHEHDFCELVLVRAGRGVHLTGEGDYPLVRGNVFLIRPGELHAYANLDGFDIFNLLYLPERLPLPLADLGGVPGYAAFFEATPGLAESLGFPVLLRLAEEETRQAETILEELMTEESAERPGTGFAMTVAVMRLILLISRAMTAARSGDFPETEQLGGLLAYLEKNIGSDLRVTDIAAENGVSVRTLERLFLRTLGRTPGDYLMELRLSRAARMLRESDLPVTRIVQRAGFSNHAYFTRSFRRRFSLCPREYRKKFRGESSVTQ